MFDVYGDEIVLDGIKVGRLEGGWPTLRQYAIECLIGSLEGYVSENDHETEIGKSYDEGYEAGRAAALLETEHSQDVARIAALLASLNKVYSLLTQSLAKTSRVSKRSVLANELRDNARSCLLELQDAARRYKA
jgi:hypothetical protein